MHAEQERLRHRITNAVGVLGGKLDATLTCSCSGCTPALRVGRRTSAGSPHLSRGYLSAGMPPKATGAITYVLPYVDEQLKLELKLVVLSAAVNAQSGIYF